MIVPGSASPLLTTTEGGGYTIAKSLRLRSSATSYLQKTLSTPTNANKWTYSLWVKRSNIGSFGQLLYCGDSSTGNDQGGFYFRNGDQLAFYGAVASAQTVAFQTNAVFRDPAAWYHLVLTYDSTQATSSNRLSLYVNGVLQTFLSVTYPTQNTSVYINTSSYATQIGRLAYNTTTNFDGYLSDAYFIDGQALTPSSFGETDSVTGVWKPKAYGGTYGTNGFYLKFTDVATTSGSNAGLGKDFSGNGNYWTTNNISVTSGATYDSMTDVPTLTSATAANYAVANPLQSTTAPTDANLKLSGVSPSTWYATVSSIGISSGKYYFEVYANSLNNISQSMHIGIVGSNYSVPTGTYIGNTSTSWGYRQDGTVYNNGSSSAYGASFNGGDTIGVALDMDNGTLVFYKNNTSQGTATTGLSGTYFPAFSVNNGGTGTVVGSINFGQRPFAYTPPTGYKALNTYNLPDSTIVAGNKYMDATTFTSTGTTQSVTNAGGFKPDLVWTKQRNATNDNYLNDSVRGAANYLVSNTTAVEASASQFLTAFNSNGFTMGTSNYSNGNSIVGWQWQAGQGTTSSNTSGSITSTVSVNASAGFSIATFTTPASSGYFTVGHGLGVTPAMVIMKPRSAGGDSWVVYHKNSNATPQNYFLMLNSTAAAANAPTIFGAAPTSTTFQFNAGAAMSTSSTCVMYSWAEIAGFSKFGSYTGNGSADGTFVYTGFRPKFFMIKDASSGTLNWYIWDSSRNTYNVIGEELYPSLSNAGSTNIDLDFLSNGIKLRNSGGGVNNSGDTFIYMAFAENPFKNALAR